MSMSRILKGIKALEEMSGREREPLSDHEIAFRLAALVHQQALIGQPGYCAPPLTRSEQRALSIVQEYREGVALL